MSKMGFRRIMYAESEMCHWCGKKGIGISVKKRSIARWCLFACGYKAFIPKKLLSFGELVKYYDPKRRISHAYSSVR